VLTTNSSFLSSTLLPLLLLLPSTLLSFLSVLSFLSFLSVFSFPLLSSTLLYSPPLSLLPLSRYPSQVTAYGNKKYNYGNKYVAPKPKVAKWLQPDMVGQWLVDNKVRGAWGGEAGGGEGRERHLVWCCRALCVW
jgi:hypothetical protein